MVAVSLKKKNFFFFFFFFFFFIFFFFFFFFKQKTAYEILNGDWSSDVCSSDLVYGPNIKDWPEMSSLTDNILLKVCSKILDPVTTTDRKSVV